MLNSSLVFRKNEMLVFILLSTFTTVPIRCKW